MSTVRLPGSSGKVMAKPGPGGGGGSGGGPTRAPYERCQGLYPWIIYPGLGGGAFATVPTIKYQPVPLESDNGDSSFGGPAIASSNHAIQDFDGDGALDAIVHNDPQIVGGAPDAWQVWFGDHTGQIGGRMFMFPTRTAMTGQLAGIGLQGADVSESSVGLIDFNGDGSPDHWRIDGSNNVNIALNKGLNLDLLTTTQRSASSRRPMRRSPAPCRRRRASSARVSRHPRTGRPISTATVASTSFGGTVAVRSCSGTTADS
jgi:hypothetical protein